MPRPKNENATEPNGKPPAVDNRQIVISVLDQYKLQKRKRINLSTATGDEVEKRILQYMMACAERNVKPTVPGLALSLGVTYSTIINHAKGLSSYDPEVKEALDNGLLMLNATLESAMQEGKTAPVSGLFLLKNNFGYKDQSEITVRPQMPLGQGKSQKSLESEYLDSVVIDPPALPPATETPK